METEELFEIKTDCDTDDLYFITKSGNLFNKNKKPIKTVKLKGQSNYKQERPLPELLAAAFLGYKIGSPIWKVGFKDENELNLKIENLKVYLFPDHLMWPSPFYKNFLYTKYPFCELKSDINSDFILVKYRPNGKIKISEGFNNSNLWDMQKKLIEERNFNINLPNEIKSEVKLNPLIDKIESTERELTILKMIRMINRYDIKQEELFKDLKCEKYF
jgi:hypothetical protein